MLFVILGSDRALAKQALDQVVQREDPGGLDTDRIDATASSFEAVFAAATAAPFFGSRRILVLQGLLAQVSSKTGRGAKAKPDSEVGRLLSSIPETTTLILFEPEISELSSQLRKQLPSDVTISSNDAPRGAALTELVLRFAADNATTLDAPTARVLLERLFPGTWQQATQNRAYDRPPSIELLQSEIAKLALAAYPGPITVDLIEDLISRGSEERVFPLLDAVISGNQRGALIEASVALRNGEDIVRTTAQIYQQIELAVGAVAAGRPSDPLEAGRALGVANAYRISKVTEAAQRSRIAPARQLRLALEIDRRLKTGRLRNPDEALVELVVRTTQTQENR